MSGIALSIKVARRKLSPGQFDDICTELLDYIVTISPVDTGLFADSWEMNVNYPSARLFNDTPYASYLDKGWSDQAPEGVTRPALAYLKTLVSNA